ncbi:MAG TPA: hypothetical protein VN773_09750 [Verrucomicrobiae bacterium]|jgi:hypothetical protein|nr:hypothetical protein [Verrucomicrobiae bacterium]
MNRYPPRRSQADLGFLALAALVATLLLSLALPLPPPYPGGVDQPLRAPAGFGL